MSPTGRSTNDRARAAIVAVRFGTADLMRIAARLFSAIVIAWVVHRALIGIASDMWTIDPASFDREFNGPEPIQYRTGHYFTKSQPFEKPLSLHTASDQLPERMPTTTSRVGEEPGKGLIPVVAAIDRVLRAHGPET